MLDKPIMRQLKQDNWSYKDSCKRVGKKGIRVNAIAPGFIATHMTEKLLKKY